MILLMDIKYFFGLVLIILLVGCAPPEVSEPVTVGDVAPAESKVTSCSECEYLQNNQCIRYVCCQDFDCIPEDDRMVGTCHNGGTLDSYCTFEIEAPFGSGERKSIFDDEEEDREYQERMADLQKREAERTYEPVDTPDGSVPEPILDDTPSSGTINCADFDCFVKASETCKKAQVTHTFTTDAFGAIQTTRAHYEISGLENGKCGFYIGMKDIDIKYSQSAIQTMLGQGMTMEMISAQEQEMNTAADEIQTRSGTCKFDTPDLEAMLKRWQNNNMATSDWDVAECSGDYFN